MLSHYESKDIFVISSNENFHRYVRENLPVGDYRISGSASGATEARQKLMGRHDAIIVINFPLTDESGSELASDLAENTSGSVVAVVRTELENEMRHFLEPFGVFVLGRPFPHAAFHQVLHDAASAHARTQTISMENQRLQTKLLDLRVINRAKWVLIQYVGMNEEQAHKYIEQQAMRMRIPKRTAAENILKTYEHQG